MRKQQSDLIDMNQYDNFLFDLYGTLIDLHTDEWAPRTWKKWMKWMDSKHIKHPDMITLRRDFWRLDHEFRANALAEGVFSHPEIDVLDVYPIMFSKYGNHLSKEAINEASWEFRKASTEYIKLYPGTEEYLKMLRENGKKVIILSNAQASYTRPEIIMFGLDQLVDDYFLSSDYRCMKPDAAYFNVPIEKYGLDRKRTIMIGDSAFSDIGGAEISKIASYQIKNGDLFIS